jgi:hypothetical protein
MLLRLPLPLLVSATILAGCSACEDDNDATPATKLQHRWTWQSSSGGIMGKTETPASTGQQRAVEFGSDGTVRWYTNGQLTSTNTYTLTTGTSIYSSQPTDLIEYSGSGMRQNFEVNGKKLVLRDEVYDGYVSEYHR